METIIHFITYYGEILKPFAVTAGLSFTAYKYFQKKAERAVALKNATADALVIAEKRIATLEEQVAIADGFDPATWLERSQFKKSGGLLQSQYDLLVSNLEEREQALHDVYLALAQYCLTSYIPGDELDKLIAGKRYAQLAQQTLSSPTSAALLRDISELVFLRPRAFKGSSTGADALTVNDEQARLGEGAYGAVLRLTDLAHQMMHAGRDSVAESLAVRANAVAQANFPPDAAVVLFTESVLASCLYNLGDIDQSKQTVDRILPVMTSKSGIRTLLTTRFLLVKILHSQKKHKEALSEIDEIIPLREKITITPDSDLFANYLLRLQILVQLLDLPRAEKEMSRVDRYAQETQISDDVRLEVRMLKIQFMRRSAASEDVVAREFEEIVEEAESKLGLSHPSTLMCIRNQASFYAFIGNFRTAQQTLQIVLDRMTPDTPYVSFYEQCQSQLKEYVQLERAP